MRALLQHLPAYNFQDLRTVFDQVYPTFQQAAVALGLFEDITEAARAMEEAITAYWRLLLCRWQGWSWKDLSGKHYLQADQGTGSDCLYYWFDRS
jgi:hypothetical protein